MTKKQKILKLLEENKFRPGCMISGSKSFYRELFPNNFVVFNANIIIPKMGKIWHGDLDITEDAKILKKIAAKFKTTFYVLREMEVRFGNENKPIKELISRAAWRTDLPNGVTDNHGHVDRDRFRSYFSKIDSKKIKICNQLKAEKYKTEINKILIYLKHPEALTTDESLIVDFYDIFIDQKQIPKEENKISKKFGFPIKFSDKIIDVAKKIKKNNV